VPPLMQTASATSGPAQKDAGLPVYPDNGAQGEGETMTEETGSYAVTRHLLHSEQGPGRVRRVTAAIVVNDRMTTEGTGKLAHTVWKPRSTEEMRQLEQLARAAVGFDATRGDQVVVENVGFSSNQPEAAPVGLEKAMDETETVLHAQPELLKTVSLSVLGLFLMFAVLRPITRQMVAALGQPSALALATGQGATQAGAIAARAGGAALGQTVNSSADFVLPRRPNNTQSIYEHISDQIRREPGQSTRLLESWINAPAEEND